jgi:Flp pilus assembly protein TadD
MPPALRSRFTLGALLILAVALCYIPAMRAGFVWDDDLLVTENPLVKNSDSLPYIWASAASTDYTPLTITAFWLQWRLWGDNPAGYHLVNILLHALSCLLLWRLLERLEIPGAWLGALLFAVHPVNVASVAWIAELKNALSLPFYLGAISAYLRYLDTRRLSIYFAALGAAAFALLSKGSTVMLPLILLLCVVWKNRRITLHDLLHLIPFVALSAVIALVTIHFQSRFIEAGNIPAPLPLRVARAGRAIWFYLGKDLCPLHLSPVYVKWPLTANYLPLILALALTALLLRFRKCCSRGLLFAWLYFIAALLPVLGMLNMTFLDQAWVADWWQQLALPAVTTLAAAGITLAWQRARPAGRPAITSATALLILALGFLTWTQASAYESMEVISRRTLALNPDAWSAHNNLGGVLTQQGKLDAAAHQYEAALRLKPTDSSAHNNLGIIYARLKRPADALSEYHASLAIAPGDAKTWCNLGNLLRSQNRNDEALDAYSHAIDNNARWTTPRYGMGSILLNLNRPAEAGRQAETIIQLEPDAIPGHYLKARAAAAIGRFDVATSEAQTALALAQTSGQQKIIAQMQDLLTACQAHQIPAAPEP